MDSDKVPGPFESIDELLQRARDGYEDEFLSLDEIAHAVYHGRRGGFLVKYADAWMNADVWNKRLMRPVFESFIRKYGLERDPSGTGRPQGTLG